MLPLLVANAEALAAMLVRLETRSKLGLVRVLVYINLESVVNELPSFVPDLAALISGLIHPRA